MPAVGRLWPSGDDDDCEDDGDSEDNEDDVGDIEEDRDDNLTKSSSPHKIHFLVNETLAWGWSSPCGRCQCKKKKEAYHFFLKYDAALKIVEKTVKFLPSSCPAANRLHD